MTMNKKAFTGFTLIELLVVIAIIGILSGLIIVSLSGAQNQAKDARIKAALDQMRPQAEIYKITYDNYAASAIDTTIASGTACALDAANSFLRASVSPDGDRLCDDIQTQGTGNLIVRMNNATGSGGKYCVSKVLNVTGSHCIDSSGYSGSTANCDITNYDCQ